MTNDGRDTIDNAKPYDQQLSHEAVKERPEALKTVENGDEIIAQIGNPAGLTISEQLKIDVMIDCFPWATASSLFEHKLNCSFNSGSIAPHADTTPSAQSL